MRMNSGGRYIRRRINRGFTRVRGPIHKSALNFRWSFWKSLSLVGIHYLAGNTDDGSKNRAKKDMQWGPARSHGQEEVRSYKPRVFAEYGKEHVPETLLNPFPYIRYGGLLQQLSNL